MDKLLLRLMLLENTLRVTTLKNYPNARDIRIEPHNQIKRFISHKSTGCHLLRLLLCRLKYSQSLVTVHYLFAQTPASGRQMCDPMILS
jgi:hypothetical protein